MVSSRFHLDLTDNALATVLPLTSVERPGWLHHINVGAGEGWLITEQIRTVTTHRFRRPATEIELSDDGLAEVRPVLARMLL